MASPAHHSMKLVNAAETVHQAISHCADRKGTLLQKVQLLRVILSLEDFTEVDDTLLAVYYNWKHHIGDSICNLVLGDDSDERVIKLLNPLGVSIINEVVDQLYDTTLTSIKSVMDSNRKKLVWTDGSEIRARLTKEKEERFAAQNSQRM